jgi:SAM-dependent methyltransferase
MHDNLAQLHIDTYNSLADEYEERVETLRPVTEYALSHLIKNLEPGSKVLDIGCAIGYTVEILRNAGMSTDGIDISPAMVEFARKRNPDSTILVGDFLAEDYKSNSYDAALLYAFIHLFPYESATECIEKVVRILKPGGLMFIGTTKSSESSEGFEEKVDYKQSAQRFRKRWTQDELESVFAINDLKIIYKEDIADEFGKVWMDYVVKKNRA